MHMAVCAGVGGVIDCGPTDHRKPQNLGGAGGGRSCGRAKHGATCLVIS